MSPSHSDDLKFLNILGLGELSYSSAKERNTFFKYDWSMTANSEKAMVPHFSTLAWKIPWMEEPGRLQSMGLWRVGRTQLSDFTFTFHFHALEKEMATHSSVLAWRIPGMGHPGGLPSMGSHRVGHDRSDLAAAAAGQQIKASYVTYWSEEGEVGKTANPKKCCLQLAFYSVFHPGSRMVFPNIYSDPVQCTTEKRLR